MTEWEQEQMIKNYMKYYFMYYMDHGQRMFEFENAEKLYVDKYYGELRKQVLDCCLLNNFFWGVWALALLSEDQYTKTGIFNYDFASARCTFYHKFKK